MRVRAVEKLQYYSDLMEGSRKVRSVYVVPAGVVFELHKDSDFRGDVYSVPNGDGKPKMVTSMDGQPIEGGTLVADGPMVRVADNTPTGSTEQNENPELPTLPKKFNSAAEVFAYEAALKEAKKKLGMKTDEVTGEETRQETAQAAVAVAEPPKGPKPPKVKSKE